jgi:hypothetical protein
MANTQKIYLGYLTMSRLKSIINKHKEYILMATKQEVADYINANYESVWTAEEEAKVDQMLNPELAEILIKLVGDVSFLTEVRDNKSN